MKALFRPLAPLISVCSLLAVLLPWGCGLCVTNEPPTYDELDAEEKAAVSVILAELSTFNKQVKRLTKHDISEILDKERINVSFEGLLFTTNLGDNRVHVAIWENLFERQQDLIARWFMTSPAKAKASYQKLFYRFLAVAQGAKQYMFKALGPIWVYGHRSLFNIERDSIRVALAHFVDAGRRVEMYTFTDQICRPVFSQYDKTYKHLFTDVKTAKTYLRDHFAELANPDDPTGYMYYLCKWIAMGKEELATLAEELIWLESLPVS